MISHSYLEGYYHALLLSSPNQTVCSASEADASSDLSQN